MRQMRKRKALITGITGQDGSYLAELLLSKGYEVHGIVRRSSTFNTHRIDHIYVDPHTSRARMLLHYGDLADSGQLIDLVYNIRPDEIYHLGAQSHVRVSFDMPEYTGNIDALGTTRILEAVRTSGIKTKFYQASSSEMFGEANPPQGEATPFMPRSPYACAKVYAYWMARNYRDGCGIFACNGILFNHESPRRGETFVTRKITMALANMLLGKQDVLYLGNLNAKRDWGYAPEYVETMWRILQQKKPGDYVIGTGESHTVREFATQAFRYGGVEIEWKGSAAREVGIVKGLNRNFNGSKKAVAPKSAVIKIDPKYFRPNEVSSLLADCRKARRELDWRPRVKFNELVKIMVDYDLKLMGLQPLGEGIEISRDKRFTWTDHNYSFYTKERG